MGLTPAFLSPRKASGSVSACCLARMSRLFAKATANTLVSPSEWRVSYHDVPTTRVLSIEASVDGRE